MEEFAGTGNSSIEVGAGVKGVVAGCSVQAVVLNCVCLVDDDCVDQP